MRSRCTCIRHRQATGAGRTTSIAALAAFAVLLWIGPAMVHGAALSQAQRETILSDAQQAYDKGIATRRNDPAQAARTFAESAARFEQLAADGMVNGPLQYNLGNAYLQSGDVGRAIVHYRAAQTLMPGDSALEHNLEYARSLRANQIEPAGQAALLSALLSWHRNTSTGVRATVFAIMYVCFWAVLIVLLRRPAGRWKWTAVALGAVCLMVGWSLAWDMWFSDPSRIGVVLSDHVTVRKGDGDGYEPQFRELLHSGVEFTVREQRPGWMRIELPDGKSGWIRNDQAQLVGDVLSGKAAEQDVEQGAAMTGTTAPQIQKS